MNQKIAKKTVICLIKNDLKHSQLVLGLNMLGFKNEKSQLDISKAVFSMMNLNINDKRLDYLNDVYSERTYQVTEIAFNDSEAINRLAIDIYNWLLKEQKRYKKK